MMEKRINSVEERREFVQEIIDRLLYLDADNREKFINSVQGELHHRNRHHPIRPRVWMVHRQVPYHCADHCRWHGAIIPVHGDDSIVPT